MVIYSKQLATHRRKKEMAFQLKLADLSQHDYLKVLVWGDQGTGKTRFGTTFPGPVLAIDVGEKGYIAFKKEAKAGKLDVTEIEDFQQLLDTLLYLRDHETKYKTIILDSMTGLSNMAIMSFLESKGKKISLETAKKWGSLTQSDYGEIANKVKPLLNTIKDLEMNVVFTAHSKSEVKERESKNDSIEATVEDESGLLEEIEAIKSGKKEMKALIDLKSIPIYVPNISRSIGQTLMAGVDYIFHSFIDATGPEPIYGIHVGPNPYFLTKARLAEGIKAPAFIADPTYQKVRAMVDGDMEPENVKSETKKGTK